MKLFPQCKHVKVFSPVWTLMWIFRCPLCAKLFPHWEQVTDLLALNFLVLFNDKLFLTSLGNYRFLTLRFLLIHSYSLSSLTSIKPKMNILKKVTNQFKSNKWPRWMAEDISRDICLFQEYLHRTKVIQFIVIKPVRELAYVLGIFLNSCNIIHTHTSNKFCVIYLF